MRAMPGCKGLSPKENREVPPLRYELVHRLKQRLPGADHRRQRRHRRRRSRSREQLQQVDGVMVGREAYHHPWSMARLGRALPRRRATAAPQREQVEAAMLRYMDAPARAGPALDARGAPHAGPVERHARGAPVAPGVVESPAEGPAAGPGGPAGRCGALPRCP